MSSAYTKVIFDTRQPDLPTATKLNLLIQDLSMALDSMGGYYSNSWRWTINMFDAASKDEIGLNTGSWATATVVNINEIADDGRDMTKSFSELFVAGNDLYLQDSSNSANNATYTIGAAGTDNGTWWSFPVTFKSGSGVPPTNNTLTNLSIFVKGAGSGGGGTGTGDMTKAIYDTNNNGKVDTADSIPWGSVTGRPTTIGDMTKAVYDVNGNGIVDTADAIAWTAVTGKPATFPPDSTAMLKSVYDTNANNKVDSAESADAAPWTGITGKPTAFPPSSHSPTHLDNGSDPIPVVTTSRTGLAPTLNGNPATYLNGTGAYSAVSGSVNPGAWTSVTPGSGWTIPTQAQYRVEVNGAVSTVYFRGMLSCAYSVLGTSAFTVPAGAFPSMTRSAVLGGAQATGTPSDVASYVASMSSGGVCTVYPLAAGPFCWFDPSQTQQVYLDGLSYSL